MTPKAMVQAEQGQPRPPAQIVISGAGIVGLVLALQLKKRVGVIAELYEQAPAFHSDVGAGMGMYPNGLRVIRDVSESLFDAVREAGHPYLHRRWERHDGTEVAVADETVLSGRDDDMQTVGIRRWRLQKVLYDAVVEAGIPVHFEKRTVSVGIRDDGNGKGNGNGGLVEIRFDDGTTRLAEVLFGADGSRSKVRESVLAAEADSDCNSTASAVTSSATSTSEASPSTVAPKLEYTGVTCIMGISETPRPQRGICLPSAPGSDGAHGAFFPTGPNEQCFQFHFPIPSDQADEGNWGTMSDEVGREECRNLAERLRGQGWDEKYLAPLETNVTNAVRIGFCLLEPALPKFVYGPRGRERVVLLGDAAHPPVPFIGQGAQMGLEDAAVIALLLQELCLDDAGTFDASNFGRAMKLYDKMRVPRTREILERSKRMGLMQKKRATNKKYNEVKEELIQRDVFFHETMPIYFDGCGYDCRREVSVVLENEPVLLPVLREEDSTAHSNL